MHPTTKQIRDAIANSTEGLTESQMRQHPEGKWDIAGIVEHLALTFSGTTRALQKCLKEERPLTTSRTLKQRLFQFVVLTCRFIPGGRKSPKRVEPTGIGGREARELLFSNLAQMDQVLAECERRFGSKTSICDHPVLGAIPVGGWRKFHLLHTRHHVKQMDALAHGFSAVNRDVATAS